MAHAVTYSHEDGIEKPAQELALLTCDRLAVAPDAAIFVDDLPINVQGGRDEKAGGRGRPRVRARSMAEGSR